MPVNENDDEDEVDGDLEDEGTSESSVAAWFEIDNEDNIDDDYEVSILSKIFFS